MSAFDRLFNPLRDAAVAFFQHDLALRRDAGGLHVVLEQRAPVRLSPAAQRAEAAARREQDALDLMRSQLAALLDELPETRMTLRHLVFAEQALARDGLKALHKLPLEVLQRALDQLEGLVTNWSPVGLAMLRSKMAVAVLDREHAEPVTEARSTRAAPAVTDTGPLAGPPAQPLVVERSDDEALAAAYAALGALGGFPPDAPAAAAGDPAAAAADPAGTAAPVDPHAPLTFELSTANA